MDPVKWVKGDALRILDKSIITGPDRVRQSSPLGGANNHEVLKHENNLRFDNTRDNVSYRNRLKGWLAKRRGLPAFRDTKSNSSDRNVMSSLTRRSQNESRCRNLSFPASKA